MPTVLHWNGYRFYFYSNEGFEPPHIHVDRGGASAKVWLDPVAMAQNIGYSVIEMNEIVRKVRAEAPGFLEAWNGYFGGQAR
ncbi:MAG TPA: DUF4160 domain-containing protein [Caulobacteraceae bacterium]|nr:DUF4160 domain-containing protein [Caulobacteraceae bacterium]